MPSGLCSCRLPDCQAPVQASLGLSMIASSKTCTTGSLLLRCPALVNVQKTRLPTGFGEAQLWPCCSMRVPSTTVVRQSEMVLTHSTVLMYVQAADLSCG